MKKYHLVTDLFRINIHGLYIISDEKHARLGDKFRLASSAVHIHNGKITRIELEFQDEKAWKDSFKIKRGNRKNGKSRKRS